MVWGSMLRGGTKRELQCPMKSLLGYEITSWLLLLERNCCSLYAEGVVVVVVVVVVLTL